MTKNSSIKQRLIGLILGVSFISVLLTTLTISIIGTVNLRDDLVRELRISASIVADRNTAALLFNDNEQAANNLNVFSVRQTIVQACIYDSNGETFASYVGKQYEGMIHCPTDLSERGKVGKKRIEVMQPIVKMNDTIGHIYIESTLDQINAYIERQTTIALSVMIAVLTISALLALRLQRGISQPILALADTARQVSRDKDYSIRAPRLSSEKDRSELILLTDSFNDMLSEISARNEQLQKQNAELERAKDAAESANRAKSQFLANVSHELRTPLNAVIGFSSILMNQLFGPLGDQKYLEYAKDINESGGHLLDVINDILDLSKAEAGKLTLTYEEVNVVKAVNKCVTILSERATQGRITINNQVAGQLPLVIVDRIRFIQIILNVLSNAVKFSEEGKTVFIRSSTREHEQVPTHLVLEIEDQGIGMSESDIQKAFQSFGQVDSGLNRKYEGTGLGLPLTKKLMELHHGSLEIKSALGKGTCVTLVFPTIPPSMDLDVSESSPE